MFKMYHLFLILVVTGCSFEKPQRQDVLSNVSVKEYDPQGRLIREKMLTQTEKPNGPEVEYDPGTGEMIKWKWNDSNNIYPSVIVWYLKGAYSSFKGNPFISAGLYQGKVVIEMVAPPNVEHIMGYKDFVGDSLSRKVAYEPEIKNDRSTVVLNEHSFVKGHQYFLYYYFMDKGTVKDSAWIELLE